MTSAPCATGCGRPSPSAALCGDCTAGLRSALELAAAIEADLLDAVARQLRHGARGKRQGTGSPLPYDPAASDARRALALALGTAIWAIIGPAWPVQDTTIAGMARWLLANMPALATSPYAGRDHDAITGAVARCTRVLDAPPELHPAGECESCGRRVLAEAGADEAVCGCGWVTRGIIAARMARAEQADVLGDSEAISRALASLGIRVAGGTIRMWVTRKRLIPRAGGQLAMSDVLALAGERDSRKAGR